MSDKTPTRKVICFYSKMADYYWLSNFSPYPITLNGKQWPTTEHYFQAQKFAGTPYEEEIRKAGSPSVAKKMGSTRSQPLRADWESVKEHVMKQALHAKFTQNQSLKKALLETGDAILVEHTENDRYWGDGGDGSGKNRLGYCLEYVRDLIRFEGSLIATPATSKRAIVYDEEGKPRFNY